jgi:hypothetical protein
MSTHPSSAFLKILNYKTMTQEVYTDYENAMTDTSDYMHDWVFHFNPYTKLWSAIPRDLYNKYWDNHELEGVLRSRDVNTLFDLLHRAKGNVDLINQLTNKK